MSGELKLFLEHETNKKISERITNLKPISTSNNPNILYNSDDIALLLGIKSINIKLKKIVLNLDKFIIDKNIYLTEQGICKIISTMRKKPHKIICEYFNYNLPIDLIALIDNIYIKRIVNIFSAYEIKIFYTFEINNEKYLAHIYFINKLVIIFDKKDIELNRQKIEYQMNVKVLQFKGFDKTGNIEFDNLLKDIIITLK